MPMTHSISWKTLCTRSSIAVAIFIVINLIVYNTSGYFERERGYQQMVAGVSVHPAVRIVFLGDSHVAQPFEHAASYLDPQVYSLATGGDSFREAFAKLRYVLEHDVAIDTVVVSADPHMFGAGRVHSANRSFADRYFIQEADRSGLDKGLLSAAMNTIPLLNDDYVQYLRRSLSGRTGHHASVTDSDSHDTHWSEMTDEQRREEAASTGREDHAGVLQYQDPFLWYGRILDLAAHKNLRVVAVRFPVDPQYLAQARPEWTAAIDQFLKEHGVSKILDLRDMPLTPRDFDDPDHLSAIGTPVALQNVGQAIGRELLMPSSVARGE
jgi:hypothetical protein